MVSIFKYGIKDHVLAENVVGSEDKACWPIDGTHIFRNHSWIPIRIELIDEMVDRFRTDVLEIVTEPELQLRCGKLGMKIANGGEKNRWQ